MIALAKRPHGPRRTLTRALLAGSLTVLLTLLPGLLSRSVDPISSPDRPKVDFGRLPFQFEPNVGQAGSEVKFVSRAPGGTFFFGTSEVLLSVEASADAGGTDTGSLVQPGVAFAAEDAPAAEVVRLAFVGADPAVSVRGDTTLPVKVNYFLGSDPDGWHTDVTPYGEVTYAGLYPGIDLTYGGVGGRLKGTYKVSPGIDPDLIRWQYGSATDPRVSVSEDGSLQVEVGECNRFTLTEQTPVAWQEIDSTRVPVEVAYKVTPDGVVGFAVGSYDATRPLVIDPVLTYSTYLGGNFAETGYDLAADPAGNFYVTGYTNSSNFPTRNAFQPTYRGGGEDGFVAKFNADGQPVYITYLGGNSIDTGYGIATDAAGNAYVTGFTASANFPIANAYQPNFGGGFYDAFVTKLNPSGSALVFSTYLGGSGHENSQGSGPQSGEIALDSAGNIYVGGYTTSQNFPTRNALQPNNRGGADIFITKFNPAANDLIWSTYLGGTNTDGSGGIAVDAQNNVGIAGYTWSDDFPIQTSFQPVQGGSRDGFVTKLNAAGSAIIFSTYLGGGYDDVSTDVDLDSAGNVYVAGFTDSLSFPLFAPFDPVFQGLEEAFVAKFTGTGSPVYSTYLGGDWIDGASGVAANDAGEAFVMGMTQSEDFPLMNPIDDTLGGSEDAFVTRFNAAGSALIFSTYLGGNDNRELQNGASLAIDDANNIYVSGDTGATDFPTTANAFQPFRGSAVDAFVSRISENSPTPTATATGSPSPSPTACIVGDYTISQGTADYVPGTTYLPNSACDNCTAPIAFPFPVRFYNQAYTQARVGSEGTIQFTGNNPLQANFCLPYGGHDNTIFAFWDNLYIGGDGVYTSLSGSAPNRVLNVEWRGQLASDNSPVRFEVRFFESGQQFEILYQQTGSGSGNSATVGVQRDTGSRSTQFSCNQPVINPGLKLTFTLGACLTPTPAGTGTLPPTATSTATSTPPTLLYSTYFGAFERDSLEDVGRDAAGNIYVMGTTFQVDIDYGDLWLAKFSPNGQQLLWQQIIGGTRIDYGFALAVDGAGNATIAGIATSNDYPLLNPLQDHHNGGIYDVVMTKYNPQGQVIFSTYLGGSGTDYAERLQTDAAGNIYLTGHTESSNWPTTPGVFQPTRPGMVDGYVTKLNPTGSAILMSTYLGGMYADEANDLALDTLGNIYVTGHTVSPDFPTLNAFQPAIADTSGDAFVTKLNSAGTALVYSTYLGGSFPPGPGEDNGQGITVDAAGSAYVTGFTEAPDFPTTQGAYQQFFNGYKDAFVTKFTPAGNALVYSTFLGGTLHAPFGEDIAYDIAVDTSGQAHITGKTYSTDFPAVNAIQPTLAGSNDAFAAKFNASGSGLVYSTYLGGRGVPPNYTGYDAGTSILIDGAGNAVLAGGTASYDFPLANPIQGQNAGESDGFIAKISGSLGGGGQTPTPLATGTAATTTVPTVTAPAGTPTRTASAVVTGTPPSPTMTATACPITFSDVPPNHTFYSFVRCLACRGIINGYPDGTFKPDNWVTRGQLSKIVSQSAGFTEPVSAQTFEDVAPGSTFYEYIERLASRQVMGGYQCGVDPSEPCGPENRPYFRPNAGATRGQLTKIVSNAAGFNDTIPDTQYQFTDVEPGSTFWLYVERLLLNRPGIMNGYPCGSPGEPCDSENRPYFRPNNPLTRGQTSKIVANTFFPGCESPQQRPVEQK